MNRFPIPGLKSTPTLLLIAGALGMWVTLAGCNGNEQPTGTPTTTVASVSINANDTTIAPGVVLRVTATAQDAGGQPVEAPISWASANIAVATVLDGLVSALAPGSTTITATGGSITAQLHLTVSGFPPTVSVNKYSTSVVLDSGTALPGVVDSFRIVSTGSGPISGLQLGSLTYTDPNNTGWLSASLNSATTPATVIVTATAALLPPGLYAATVPIRTVTNGLGSGGANVSVTLDVRLPPETGVAKVVASDAHRCKLTMTGKVFCSGQNSFGQLGTGDTIARSTPTALASNLTFSDIGAGGGLGYNVNFTCGIAAGTVYCWGNNAWGQVGDETHTTRLLPTPVHLPAGVSFTQLSVGAFHACALTKSGTAYCWGGPSTDGNGGSFIPTQPVAGGLVFQQISAGAQHACGITTSGATYCWGRNSDGQVGNGNMPFAASLPTLVTGSTAFVEVATGANHTCARTAAGAAYCWGWNGAWQIGDGTTISRSTPTQVTGGANLHSLSGGAGVSCGLNPTGAVICWGTTSFIAGTPPAIQTTSPAFLQLSAGAQDLCAVSAERVAYCWWAGLPVRY